MFSRIIRLAEAAMRIDDVVVSVDAAEDGILAPLDNLRFSFDDRSLRIDGEV